MLNFNIHEQSFGEKDLKLENPDNKRILNPTGYVGMSKSIASLLYNGNMSYFNQVLEHFDVTDEVQTDFDSLTVNEIQKMSSVEKLQHIQNINRKINNAIMEGTIKRREAARVQAEKDASDLAAYRALQAQTEQKPDNDNKDV